MCVYWSLAMFLNVHLTQGRTDVSLLLQPLSFSLCWLILPGAVKLGGFHTSHFCAILVSHLINLPNLLAPLNVFDYLLFIAKHIVIPLLLRIKRTEQMKCTRRPHRCAIWSSGCCQISCDTTDGLGWQWSSSTSAPHYRNQYAPLLRNLKLVFKQLYLKLK